MSEANSTSGNAVPWWRAPWASWARIGAQLVALWLRLVERHPLVALVLVIIWPNVLWSFANLLYNVHLIVNILCTEAQREAFWNVAVPTYNVFSWAFGLGICVILIHPLFAYYRAQKRGAEVPAAVKQAAQRRVVSLPFFQLRLNFILWMPGGLIFPLLICAIGGPELWWGITAQFLLSFLVSAVVTTFQTFIFLERFLVMHFYPKMFTDVRPVEVAGIRLISFQYRLWLLWGAVSLGPIIVLTLVTANLLADAPALLPLTIGVVAFGIGTGIWIFNVIRNDLSDWLEAHVKATAEIARQDFTVRIPKLRSDEWGRLTDSFNQMAHDLSVGMRVRDMFGQFVGPDVRDTILQHYPELGGKVQEITVMFADIRGFTQRAAGKEPEEVVDLLNRFLSLAVQAVNENGGWVDKFLGDGFMALFGAPLPAGEHAGLAVAAALDLLQRLDGLNRDLERHGQAPLKVGIGIHTGPALVGCIGATVPLPNGQSQIRREFTAIGETVNLTQRLEELTKMCGETLLFSEATRFRLKHPPPLTCLGPQEIRGSTQPLVVYRADEIGERRGVSPP